jgi:hypothetical protein
MFNIQQAMLAIDVGWKSQRIKLARQTLGAQDFDTLHDLLLKYPTIKSLELCACQAEENDIMKLARRLKDYNLVGLQLAYVEMSDDGAAALATAIQECPLKKLDLTYNRIGVKGGLRLAHALKDSGLECLLLARNELKTSIINLAEVLGNNRTTLKSLDVSENEINNEGAMAIAKALPQTGIEVLLMDMNSITEDGVVAICDAAITSSSLTELSLSGNDINSDESQKSICSLLKKSQIERLALNSTDMDGQMLDKLALGVRECLSIQVLDLKDNSRIDDASIRRFLHTVGPHRSLRTINLDGTTVSRAGDAEIVQRLYNLHNERARSLTILVAAKLLARLGCNSSIQLLPLDALRHLALML